ncbi:serine aminopeptidase domain-containing protein, partial [Staphylococcus epidermidis]|uniref:serine aminopeptidase domain-containing protein n=1 Tax=Staphylococcus epidermidis TaxID=1282 RepID=UPI0037DA5174
MSPHTYIQNNLTHPLSSHLHLIQKYKLDHFNPKQISIPLLFSIIHPLTYFKHNPQQFTHNIFIFHPNQDALLTYLHSLHLYQQIPSAHKSLHIYHPFHHEIFNQT